MLCPHPIAKRDGGSKFHSSSKCNSNPHGEPDGDLDFYSFSNGKRDGDGEEYRDTCTAYRGGDGDRAAVPNVLADCDADGLLAGCDTGEVTGWMCR